MAHPATSIAARNSPPHHALRVIAYVFAVIVGLGVLPTAFSVADRATVVRVSNDLLDLVSR